VPQGDAESPYGTHYPRKKQQIGYRLHLAARAIAYGDREVEYEGPTVQNITLTNGPGISHMHITFLDRTIKGGLTLQDLPCPQFSDGTSCESAEIQSSGDGKWHFGVLSLEGDTLQVDFVIKPWHSVTGVRYGHSEWPHVLLYNKHGLPAPPFLVDHTLFPVVPQ
jgi:sialate O-acetylesterase